MLRGAGPRRAGSHGAGSRAAGAAGAIALLSALGAWGCVTEGPPALPTAKAAKSKAPVRMKASPPRDPVASASASPDAAFAQAPVLTEAFFDDFERAELGPRYHALSPAWRIERGRLCARGARNRGVWLVDRLPEAARIEVDAIAGSPDGDLKLELWGDGRTGATKATYDHASGYVAILGGWRNSRHVLARLDEHGDDRLALAVDPASDDERARPVAEGQVLLLVCDRSDGKTLTWSVGDVPLFTLRDPEPLRGQGHEHVGFNDWEAPVCFDNLRVTPSAAAASP